jgi:hypothetical protein
VSTDYIAFCLAKAKKIYNIDYSPKTDASQKLPANGGFCGIIADVQSYWYFRPSLARLGLRKIKLIEGNGKFRSLKKIDLQKELFRSSLASVGLRKIKLIEDNGKFRNVKS